MLFHEFRQTIRNLGRNRGFALAIILSLALGMGATSAIFAVIYAALFKPLPFADAERLVMLHDTQRSADGTLKNYRVSPQNFDAWRKQNRVFEELMAMNLRNPNLTGSGEPVRLRGVRVTSNCFSTLGVKPLLGRIFSSEEDKTGGPAPVAVISHGLWHRRFAGDPSIVGESLTLDDESFTVIGVMPPGFAFPEGVENRPPRDVWMPMGLDPERLPERGWHYLFVIGRLRPGVLLEQAQAEMETIAQRMALDFPQTHTGFGVQLVPLRRELIRKEIESPLWLLMMGVGFLLLIACTNVASMLLARAITRSRDVAVRIVQGAGPTRLLRFVFTETLLLALLGTGAGLLLARFTISPLIDMSELKVAVPAFRDIAMDLPVLAFILLVAITTGILFGLAPALKLFDTDLREALLEGSTRTGAGRWERRFHAALVIGQIALVLVLLVGAGLALKSFRELVRVDPGFETENRLTMRLFLSRNRYPDQARRTAYIEQVLAKVRVLPGVESATATTVLPIGDLEVYALFSVRGRAPAEPNEMLVTNSRLVSSDFFTALGLPIVEGRPLTINDHADSPGVVVVSRHMARQYWPGSSPLGRQVKRGGPNSEEPWLTIVGVAEDVRDTTLDAEIGSTWYLPYSQHQLPGFRLIVHTAGEPMSFLPAVRKVIWSIHPHQPIVDVSTVADIVSGSIGKERFTTFLLSLFAGLGLILAALGIYGVMSYSVNQRIPEIGIRMALGAQNRQVRRMVLRQGAMLAATGLAIGLALSFIANRFLASLIVEVGPTDPVTVTVMAIFLAAIALMASYLPAHRATRVDPAVVLKSL